MTIPQKEFIQGAFAALSEKEQAVATMIAAGYDTDEIALLLKVTERCAQGYIGTALDTMRLSSRTQLATAMWFAGLVEPTQVFVYQELAKPQRIFRGEPKPVPFRDAPKMRRPRPEQRFLRPRLPGEKKAKW